MRKDGHDHSSARYRAMVFTATPDERAAIESQVTATLATTFGDTPSLSTGGYRVGGLGWITSNDMPFDKRNPQDHPAWVARIEKARCEIEEHKSECRVKVLAESFSRDDVLQFIGEIRRWTNSLQKQV